MKIITWNINGYRSVTGQNPSRRLDIITHENKLFDYIARYEPDVIGLQETKADPSQINDELIAPPGYNAYYHSCKIKKGYSGVVTFTKSPPTSVNYSIGIDRFDNEGRIIEIDYHDILMYNVYFPKAYADNDKGRLDYKLDFYDALFKYISKKLKSGRKVIVSGDYNTAHFEIDLARPKDNHGTSGFLDVERKKLDEIVKMGFADAFRIHNKQGDNYTWWAQRANARQKNVGWRIDYHFISEDLAGNLVSSVQQPEEYGSDHCPVVVDLNI